MANTILIKKKTTTGPPSLGSLSDGEMCLVVPDSDLYQRVDGSTLILVNGNLSDAEVETAALNQGFLKAQAITQAEYDALSPPDANTIYFIQAPSAIYNGQNVLDPVNNSNSLTGIDVGTDFTAAAITDPDDGAKSALELTRTKATGSAAEALIDLTGLGNGETVVVTIDANETVGTVFDVGLLTSRGWTAEENINASGTMTTITFASNTTDSATPIIRVRSFGAGQVGDKIVLRNITIN